MSHFHQSVRSLGRKKDSHEEETDKLVLISLRITRKLAALSGEILCFRAVVS